MTAGITIAPGDPRAPEALALLASSHAFMAGRYPPEHNYQLDADALAGPGIRFLIARGGGHTGGCGAGRMREGALQPVLYRRERAGVVRAGWERGGNGRRGPRRRIYRLAKGGKRELTGRREQWREFVSVIGKIVEAPA